MAVDLARVEVLRALADPTRHELYRALDAAAHPLTTTELAEGVGLHPNTVRAHLEHLVAVGLVRVDTAAIGGRGRPRHRFTVARPPVADEPPAAELARALVLVAREAGAGAEELRQIGRRSVEGGPRGSSPPRSAPAPPPPPVPGVACGPARPLAGGVADVMRHERRGGYQPALQPLGRGRWRLSFRSCPYWELAQEAPDVVCAWHQGAVEGVCSAGGQLEVEAFSGAGTARGCNVVLAPPAVPDPPPERYDSRRTKEDPT